MGYILVALSILFLNYLGGRLEMAYSNPNQVTPTIQGYSLFNRDAKIDKTMLAFSMWKTTIRIGIFPLIESENDDQPKVDRKGGLSIYLTPFKAHMFAEILTRYKSNPEQYSGKGIPSGQCLISIEDPRYAPGYNKPDANPLIVIRKVSPETGAMEASYAYEINDNFYAIVDSYDQTTGQFTKNFDEFKGIEIDIIITQLESYYRAMTNATAFSVVESQYQYLDKIANKLGVELMANNFISYRSNSYFNSPGVGGTIGGSTDTMGGTANSLANMI
jgi:hypothetical protein